MCSSCSKYKNTLFLIYPPCSSADFPAALGGYEPWSEDLRVGRYTRVQRNGRQCRGMHGLGPYLREECSG